MGLNSKFFFTCDKCGLTNISECEDDIPNGFICIDIAIGSQDHITIHTIVACSEKCMKEVIRDISIEEIKTMASIDPDYGQEQ